MGLNYGFELITHAHGVDRMLRTIADHLVEVDATRLRAALPWVPAIVRDLVWGSGPTEPNMCGVHGLASRAHDQPNSVCLGFEHDRDDALAAYFRELSYGDVQVPERIVVGCMHTTLDVGKEYARLRSTSATSSMSRAIQGSPSVRDAWSRIARESGALAAFFDDERDLVLACFWPESRVVHRVGLDSFCSGDLEVIRVDAYCYEQLKSL